VERWLYSRRLSVAGGLSLPVKDSGRHTALVFRQLCAQAGIALGLPQAAPAPADAVLVARVASRPLKEIVTGLLHHSNNMSAELIGLAASRKLTGQALDLAASSGVLVAWLQRKLPAVDWRGFVLVNHSGLSAASRASPRHFVGLLSLVDADPDFAATLPSIDHEDELLVASLGPPAMEAVGKTGTMDYIRGLAGFLPGHDGRRLAFALFILDAEKRRRFDAAFDPRILEPSPETRSWQRRARDLDHALMRRWVATY
jgi:D-alanyl-D-alanine carboxypeptidase/D-alanyl-D-alanine-endopeptidase (penicillin-binding protein 4)